MMSGVFISENRRWMLPEFLTWNCELKDRSVALFSVAGRVFPKDFSINTHASELNTEQVTTLEQQTNDRTGAETRME